jgi:hypothetical protein
VVDVYEFIKALPGCASYADEFRSQEIDGQALMLLKEDHSALHGDKYFSFMTFF